MFRLALNIFPARLYRLPVLRGFAKRPALLFTNTPPLRKRLRYWVEQPAPYLRPPYESVYCASHVVTP